MRFLSLVLCLWLVGGCTTSAVSLLDAQPVAKDELYAFQTKKALSSAKITIIRDSGLLGGGCDIVAYINGIKSGSFSPGQRASFFVAPGKVDISIALTNSGLCNWMAVKTISATLSENRESVFRINADTSGFYIGPHFVY